MAGDPYKELGVAKGASADEIKKAFRKLAKELHPDKNPGDKVSEERFKRITAAFDLLGDAEKRAKYDRGEIDADGREQFRAPPGGGGRSGGFGGFGGSGGRGGFEDIDLEELFGAFGGGGRTAGRGGFGGGKGQDVRATLDISLEDSIAGTTRRIQFSDGRMLDVVIPKGASEGQVIRLKGQGAPGRGGQAGDALIELKIAPHPVFKRDGADLTMDLAVSVPDAVLGGKIQVPTPEGAVMMTIPKGSNSGKILRLKGRGAYAGGKRGDLLAKLAVTLPETPDDELIRFATEWRDKRPYTPGR
ncbi:MULTISPECIES: DnaJ C-terminal domain-containing protein [unclassified Brevundimonas]|uniref:DnaJ C-terminal domain-containing protein n=1 Tax=unclassified Brevundimonas TaxID=2622653 RepID=UPI000CFB264D|nr:MULTISPECIES: DnaJ C-terminal domain-containing protein [unclassified Brevundimonas]PRA29951.1 molecular chaperone DnaJ [Brevundimonas sp. MYb27]PQZ80891.1 molecular chaperone DnaJ [Brevundimonas sp. MYb31]PRB14009.1 molecular chaperone DnaJ [Brevundimonas sp. MYb52]PRB33273.1 molecular chaperone DnaJ [Brevundimonas sp. MYb46]PRB50766.1 molecular chaperone DnaJ [Brevundimonas sp. MYb33]